MYSDSDSAMSSVWSIALRSEALTRPAWVCPSRVSTGTPMLSASQVVVVPV